MERAYLKYAFIVVTLSVGGWIALWLPAYLPPSPPYDYNAAEVRLDYIKYILIMLIMTGLCLIPIIVGSLFICLLKIRVERRVVRLVLAIMYFPTLLMASSSFYDNVNNLAVTLYSAPATLIYLLLVAYLTLGFPLRTR